MSDKKLFTILTLGTILGTATPFAHAEKSYYIDQLIDYSSCGGANLFDDTTALKSRMDTAAWSGYKFTDGYAWATDFREACSSVYGASGADSSYADHYAFSVFSGHGSQSTLYFGTAHDTCSFNIDNQARLGSMAGSVGAVAMYIACSTLSINGSGAPLSGGTQWLNQQLGFHGLTGNQTSAYGYFFDDTATKTNAQAWLDRLSDQPAVAISYSNGSLSCWTVDGTAKLKGNYYTSPRGSGPSCGSGQPLYQWCSRWVN